MNIKKTRRKSIYIPTVKDMNFKNTFENQNYFKQL